MPALLLALDQGTTNTKSILMDASGAVVFRTSMPLTLSTPHGLVEQDLLEIWETSRLVLTAAAKHARELGWQVEGIAISNQRETSVAWDCQTGQPLAPAISWQCRRSKHICDRLVDHANAIRRCSGLPLDPVLSATKWAWLLENVGSIHDAAVEQQLRLGTVDAWLVHQLTGGLVHATDFTNASRTGLLDLSTQQWSPAMLQIFGIPIASLPQLRSSSGDFGICMTIPELKGVPLVTAIGDSHAALAGHASFGPSTIKATYGTGSSLMTLTSALPGDTPQLARTVAWSLGNQPSFALEGNIFMTGSAVQFIGEFLQLAEPLAAAIALSEEVPSAAGAYFVPAMVGLGAPHWNTEARGLFCGLERAHTLAHLARAAVDSIAFQVADVFFEMQKIALTRFEALHVDGGATRNSTLMQLQADVLGVPVYRSLNEELSAVGAAYLGGLALRWWFSLDDIADMPRAAETFCPKLSAEARAALYQGWQQAVHRATRSLAELA